jgi:hypothetical protein
LAGGGGKRVGKVQKEQKSAFQPEKRAAPQSARALEFFSIRESRRGLYFFVSRCRKGLAGRAIKYGRLPRERKPVPDTLATVQGARPTHKKPPAPIAFFIQGCLRISVPPNPKSATNGSRSLLLLALYWAHAASPPRAAPTPTAAAQDHARCPVSEPHAAFPPYPQGPPRAVSSPPAAARRGRGWHTCAAPRPVASRRPPPRKPPRRPPRCAGGAAMLVRRCHLAPASGEA